MNKTLLKEYINKTVSFRYSSVNFTFNLSLSLFSSYDIDAGSKLLLKTITQNLDLSAFDNIIDLGCGTGVLGICLKKKNPELNLYSIDRDALALRFTELNAELNGIKKINILAELGFCTIPEGKNIVISNLPAKAGGLVLRSFINNINGVGAVVIVKPLKNLLIEILNDFNAEITFKEETRKHFTVHFYKESENNILPSEELEYYIRNKIQL